MSTPRAAQVAQAAQAALAGAARRLSEAGIEGAAGDARRLLAHVMGLEPSRLTLHLHDDLTLAQQDAFEAALARRAAREPVSHITGRRIFYGRDFAVTADVLDPRGDTETLIEAALAERFERVLDLGTGSGCIVLTLLAEAGAEADAEAQVQGLGTDVSEAALDVARGNAARLGIGATFLRSDWFEAVEGTFDLIVSNPPYIAAEEMAGLAPELAYEPRLALTDEGDGLSCYRTICAGAGAYLSAGGRLMVEIGWSQGAAVAEMMRAAGLEEVQILKDLGQRERVVWGRKPA